MFQRCVRVWVAELDDGLQRIRFYISRKYLLFITIVVLIIKLKIDAICIAVSLLNTIHKAN